MVIGILPTVLNYGDKYDIEYANTSTFRASCPIPRENYLSIARDVIKKHPERAKEAIYGFWFDVHYHDVRDGKWPVEFPFDFVEK